MHETTSPLVINVSQATFAGEVVERSRALPVLVDFWAPWCAPCRHLGPLLEKLAQEFQGAFLLAKVNTEDNPAIAQDYQIQSIPHVMIFRDGQPVDGFVGLYPETYIRAFLKRHCPTPVERLLAEAREKDEAEGVESAEPLYRQALVMDSQNGAGHLALARLALQRGQTEEARAHLNAIPSLSAEGDSAERLASLIPFLEEGLSTNEILCRKSLAEDPTNPDALYHLSSHLAAQRRFAEALDQLLAIAAHKPKYREEAARKTMLALFSVLGDRSPLSDEYRQRLARILY